MTLLNDIDRFVSYKQQLGLVYKQQSRTLRAFGNWAAQRGERHILRSSAAAWASATSSSYMRRSRLLCVRQLAKWLQAEDPRHEIPSLDTFGRKVSVYRRPTPKLLSEDQIRLVLNAAFEMRPADSINRYTYHYCIGLVAATGLRAAEACSLQRTDFAADGLVIRNSKFGKSRLIALHPSTRQALERYLSVRRHWAPDNDDLFVLSNGRTLYPDLLSRTFRRLTRKIGLRGGPGTPGSRLHDLRHAFATRSIESAIAADRSAISRHMLALSTYMGHAEMSSTYWYLEATPALLEQVADAAQCLFNTNGGAQ